MTTEAPAFDEAKVEEFMGKVVTDAAGLTTSFLVAIGDKLGLFKDLATGGPATSEELAQRTSIDERYAREWLGAMTTGGYLAYDPATKSFSIPPEHVPILADENSPMFFGGFFEGFLGMGAVIGQVIDSFRNGGGVPQSAYPPEQWSGLERGTAAWFNHLLLPVWIPAVPDVQAALERGIDVADVGCGAGRALVKLGEAFPNSRFVGFDIFSTQVERAREAIADAGLSDRVRIEQADVAQGLPDKFDLITTFDVIHDSADPLGLLTAIRGGLRPGGFYLCLDINCSDKLEENVGPLGSLMYGASIFYCMTTSLAQGGEGLGTLGLHEKKLRELSSAAGFSSVERVEIENPFNSLYLLRP